jgi:hypothetical protein
MDDDTEVISLADGRVLTVRPAVPADIDGLLEMYVELTVSSSDHMPGWPPASDHPRLLIEGCGSRWSRTPEAHRAGWTVVACAGPGSNQVPSCPLFEGGHCPLVDGADEIVLAFAPNDPRAAQLARVHAARTPDKPVRSTEEWTPTVGEPAGRQPIVREP